MAKTISQLTTLSISDGDYIPFDTVAGLTRKTTKSDIVAGLALDADLDSHVNNTSNPHSVTKTQVGLSNVDNTSDATKNSASATLTNKTINANSNTITNIGASEIEKGIISDQTEDTSPDDQNDFLFTYDNSATATKKVKPKNLYTKRALKNVITYTSGSGTYTPSAGISAILVKCVAGGGAGGSADGNTSNAGAGSGGSGGGYVQKLITSLAASYSYAVGAGGTPGAAGNNPGGDGNNTTFSGTGTSIVAEKGYGGGGSGTAGTSALVVGGAGTIASTGGDLNISGNSGGASIRFSGTLAVSGFGGSSGMGFGGGGQARTSEGNGIAGGDYGGGGSGGVSYSTTDKQGGAGAGGIIIIEEYI